MQILCDTIFLSNIRTSLEERQRKPWKLREREKALGRKRLIKFGYYCVQINLIYTYFTYLHIFIIKIHVIFSVYYYVYLIYILYSSCIFNFCMQCIFYENIITFRRP